MAERETLETLSLRIKALEETMARELNRSLSDREELFASVRNSKEDRKVLHDAIDLVADGKPPELSFHALMRTIPGPILAVIVGALISIGTVETAQYFTVQEHSRILTEYEVLRKQRETQFNQISEKMGRIEERLAALLDLWNPRAVGPPNR